MAYKPYNPYRQPARHPNHYAKAEHLLRAAALAASPPDEQALAWVWRHIYLNANNSGLQSEGEKQVTKLLMRNWRMTKAELCRECKRAHQRGLYDNVYLTLTGD